MKEILLVCPYCHKPLIDEKYEFTCNRCHKSFIRNKIECPICFSQIISHNFKYQFCSNWNCPSFFKYRKCKLNLDKYCNECDRNVVDFGKVIVNYKFMCGLYKVESQNFKMEIMNNRMVTNMDFQSHYVLRKVIDKYIKLSI